MATREINSSLNIMNTRLSISETGSGMSYLALHDNPGSKYDLSAVASYLTNEKGKLVNLDRPGYNCSEDIINTEKDPYLDSKLYAELIDRTCNGKVNLIGYSFGAYTALKIASKFPEKVQSMIFFSPYILPINESISTIPNYINNAIIGTLLGIFVPHQKSESIKEGIEKRFSPVVVEESYFEKWLPRFTRFESILASLIDTNQMIQTYEEVHNTLKNSKISVKVLFGRQDKFMDIEKQSSTITQIFPNANIKVEENMGHAIPITNPQTCAEFLNWK